MIAAIYRAGIQRAIIPEFTLRAHTHKINAFVAVAIVRTHSHAAVVCAPTRLAITYTVNASTMIRAVLRTRLHITHSAGEARRTVAGPVEAIPVVSAVLRAGVE